MQLFKIYFFLSLYFDLEIIDLFSGYKRDDLINFDEGLKHVLLYDIVTHSGKPDYFRSYISLDHTRA